MLKIRRSRDRLIFNMGIPILVRRCLYTETGPRFALTDEYNSVYTLRNQTIKNYWNFHVHYWVWYGIWFFLEHHDLVKSHLLGLRHHSIENCDFVQFHLLGLRLSLEDWNLVEVDGGWPQRAVGEDVPPGRVTCPPKASMGDLSNVIWRKREGSVGMTSNDRQWSVGNQH